MKGLLLKDFLVITKQLKIFLLVIPIMALIGGTSMSALAILLGAVLPMTAIAYDERSKWIELAVMMPYSKKELVINKYLLGYSCMFGAAVLVVLGQFIVKTITKEYMGESIQMLIFAIIGGLIFIAVNTPILFKYGSEKGRFVFIIAMALIGASGSILKGIGADALGKIPNISPIFFLGLAVVMNMISIVISIGIKLKDE
ncbi:MAG: ABC-2 transporter permease [Lachnospiraceae bacterium]